MKTRIIGIVLFVLCGAEALRAGTDERWQLRTADYDAPYVGAPMASGRIGLLPWREPFSVRQVVLNHVFDTDGAQGVSRVLRGINPFLLSMQVDGHAVTASSIADWEQAVDMKRATHTTRFTAAGKAAVDYRICALRNLPYAGLIEVSVEAQADLTLTVAAGVEVPEEYVEPTERFKTMWAEKRRMDMLQAFAFSAHRRVAVAASSAFLFDGGEDPRPAADESGRGMHFTVKLKKGDRFRFALVGAVCSGRDFCDPWNEAERQVIYAACEGIDALVAGHTRRWEELWQSDIRIEGDDDAQRIVRFALFNLYSSCLPASRLSIPPMGLSSQGYNGHIFWDSEIWMYPPLLLLNEEIARSMVDYRIDRLAAARQKAAAYGYRGAMFPWESDDRGEESTPTFALTGPLEHHVTADIAIACWNYYCVTRDELWLRSEAFALLREAADFWVSRAHRNDDGSYSIRNVVGADEYANGVDDNAFTNASAARALEYACKAAKILGMPSSESWRRVGENLRILHFADGVLREHATYDGEMIKQADANLLGYPLGLVAAPDAQRRDMEYYAERIDPRDGPAMSYSIFCIQYARMGDAERAYELFLRCHRPNLRAPFGVLAETAASDNPYFMTGAGGLLQAVVNGFGGLQITDKGVVQLPSVLPVHWKRLIITGVGPEKRTYERVGR